MSYIPHQSPQNLMCLTLPHQSPQNLWPSIISLMCTSMIADEWLLCWYTLICTADDWILRCYCWRALLREGCLGATGTRDTPALRGHQGVSPGGHESLQCMPVNLIPNSFCSLQKGHSGHSPKNLYNYPLLCDFVQSSVSAGTINGRYNSILSCILLI